MDADLVYRRCLHELRALDGVRRVEGGPPRRRRRGIDVDRLRLVTSAGESTYVCQVQAHVTPATVGVTLARLPHGGRERALLLADHIPPTVADMLAARDIDFVDTAGNARLRIPGLFFVDIRGRRREGGDAVQDRDKLVTAVGLHVLFALLARGGTLGPYRELAALAGTSAAGVTRVLAELRRRGFMVDRRREPRLVAERTSELVDLWARGYAEELRPRLVFQRFRAPGSLDEAVNKFAEMAARQDVAWVLTGAFGADVLTQYLRGDRLSMIVRIPDAGALNLPVWSPSAEGPITLMRAFSPLALRPARTRDGWPAAHPLLVYAELLADGRSREIEAAQTVRQQYLQDLSGAA